jgi:uncharacterized protein (DUF433 family)
MITIPEELQAILSSDPDIMGGDVCFACTRIPVVMLLDNVAASVPMNEFYDDYADLTPQQVETVLGWENRKAREALGLELVI